MRGPCDGFSGRTDCNRKMLWTKKLNSSSKGELHVESHKGKTLKIFQILLCNKMIIMQATLCSREVTLEINLFKG